MNTTKPYFRHFFLSIFILGIPLISCNNKDKDPSSKETSNLVKNAKTAVKEASEMKDNIQLLREKEHLTKDEWESWMPKTLLDLPINSSQINFMPGLGSCGATYKIGNKSIRVMVIDGAGEKGASGVGPYRMSSKINYDEKGSWGTTKTKTINGLKVKESDLKDDTYNLSLFYGDRFAVDIKTNEVAHDELQQILTELDLERLAKQ
ncbi:hypothetical protein [Allomuricauda sp. F6463D]|uniref:hypothetical protein n=1 Tax=Allomuricauda sp. F6463D TaxID=2926409 RepID=UPI001FF47EDA|nr:hypothetical protein [Muricauda sp. F6463D]MCK0159981.1 hypothetical protein [Muricauda sp. F6463D]